VKGDTADITKQRAGRQRLEKFRAKRLEREGDERRKTEKLTAAARLNLTL